MEETSHPETEREERTELAPGEEPVVTGTLFLTLVIMMLIFGFWALFYFLYLDR